jgi:hypothetical protein
MITSKTETITRKVWTLESLEGPYECTEPEVSGALTQARVAYSNENPLAPDSVDFWDAIRVSVTDGKIVVSYTVESP